MDYYLHLGVIVGMYIILAQSLNVTFGLGGVFNLAHVAAYAIGAYITALGSTQYNWPWPVCLVVSMLGAGFLALPIGAISLRLTQDYFAIGTLAFSAVINALLINWKSLTNGVLGISGIPRPKVGDVEIFDTSGFLIFTWSIVLVSQLLMWLLFRNFFSRAMRAQSENEEATISLGIDTGLLRLSAFWISSSFAGLAGALFAFYLNYIDPSSFGFSEMVFVLAIVITGRPGSFWGIIFSGIFLVLLPEPLRFIEFSPGVLGPLRQMLYAIILFLVVFVNRERLFPVERQV